MSQRERLLILFLSPHLTESAAGDDEAVVEEVKHAVERLATHSGAFALEEGVVGGTLRLVFDNTFSWVRQKVVTLRVRCR